MFSQTPDVETWSLFTLQLYVCLPGSVAHRHGWKSPDILLKDTSGLALTCGVVLRLSVVLLPLSIPGNVPASHFKTPAFELQIVLMSL